MKHSGNNLIFLISQPRSGSTLTQRILGAHSQIHTQSEPWIMLHPLNALKSNNIQTAYDIDLYIKGAKDFINHLPGKESQYKETISEAYQKLYCTILEQEKKRLFLDKTPRYYYIIEELSSYFPKAKFIFLWRNPAAVLTSIVKTWTKKDWYRLSEYKGDLLYAPQWMLDGVNHLENKSFVLSYEELLKNPHDWIKNICNFISVSYEENIIEYGQFKVPAWQYGDQITVNNKGKPDNFHADTWHEYLNNPQMWRVIYDYVHYLGNDLISSMGYSLREIKNILEKNKPNLDVNAHTLSLTELLDTNRSILIEKKRLQNDIKNAFDGIRIRDESLKNRNDSISQKDRIIGEKEKLIHQSNLELSKKQSVLEEKIIQIDALQSIIEKNNNHIEKSLTDINLLAKNLSEKDILFETQNKELTNLKDELNSGLLQIEKLNAKIEHLVGEAAQKDGRIDKQSEEIKQLNTEIISFKLNLKDKESQIEQLESAIASLKISLKDKESQVVQLGSHVSALNLSLKNNESQSAKKDAVIARMSKELELNIAMSDTLQNQLSKIQTKFQTTEEQKLSLKEEKELLFKQIKKAKNLESELNIITQGQKMEIYELKDFIKEIEKSYTFRIGKAIIWPASRLKHMLKK